MISLVLGRKSDPKIKPCVCFFFFIQNIFIKFTVCNKKCVIKLLCNGCIIVFWDRNHKCIYCDISLLKYLWLDLLNPKPIFNFWIMLNEFCIFDMWIKILIYTLDYYYYIIPYIIYGDCNESKNNISRSSCDIGFGVHVRYWYIYIYIFVYYILDI